MGERVKEAEGRRCVVRRRIMVLVLAMLLAVSMTAGPVFAGVDGGKKDDDGKGKGKVVCLVKHKNAKGEIVFKKKLPYKAAQAHKKHGDYVKCFNEKPKKDKDKDKDKK